MKQVVGDLFDYPVIGHGVNTRGVMGAGVAVGFRDRFPTMFENYRNLCRTRSLFEGDVQVWYENGVLGFNIASQDLPGPNAKAHWLESGLRNTSMWARKLGVTSVTIPEIGCGIGGLNRDDLDYAISLAEFATPSVEYTVVTLK